jgi:hypothetical protein
VPGASSFVHGMNEKNEYAGQYALLLCARGYAVNYFLQYKHRINGYRGMAYSLHLLIR